MHIGALARGVTALALGCLAGFAGRPAAAQGTAERDYLEAVATYFSVAPQEVAILREWGLTLEEVPVVLFVAGRAGVPADVVVAIREGGASWGDLARRFGVDADEFHVRLESGNAGSLARAYQAFAATPQREWPTLALEDDEIVSLVNIRVLAQDLSMPPDGVLAARDRVGSYVGIYGSRGRGRP